MRVREAGALGCRRAGVARGMDADRGGDAPVEAPLADRTNAGAGPGKRPAGWVPSFGRVGRKRPLAEGLGGAAEPDRDGGDDEPPGGDAFYDDDDDDQAVPLSVAELYHEDDEDAPEAEANKNTDGHPEGALAAEECPDAHPREECPVCPVCFLRLADVADTALARVAHVNACLDGAMDGVIPVETLDGALEGGDRGGGVDPEVDPESAFLWHEGGEGEWHDVAAWAHAVDSPPAFASAIVRRRVTFARLARLSDADLREMGVDTLGARKRLAAAIAERAKKNATLPAEPDKESAAPASGARIAIRSAGWHPTRVASAVAPVFRRAAEGGASSSRRVSHTEASRQRLFSGGNIKAKRVAETADANAFSSRPTIRSRYVPATSPDPPPPPPWIRVPGTRFIVDGFQGYGKSHSRWCTNWFLTHFHADHYKGLTKKTPDPRNCVIWCSRPTAELCRSRLGIQKERLRVVDVGRPFVVEGVSVRFVDANHCPGAVMIVFDGIPKTKTSATDTDTVLATGDFRFHAGMTSCPILRDVASKRPAVMLDTTYCDPKHAFPPQTEVLAAVRDAVRAEAHNAQRTLFLFGTYTIGKERVFFEAARALGPETKIYVGKQKRLVLEALGDAVPAEDMRRVTSDDAATNLHVVPMGSVTFERMKTIARYYKNRYDTVVAFKPTGWTFTQARKHTAQTKRQKRGALIQYAVPYSEHSSFKELREFVRFLKPRAILPHVGNDRGENAARMVRALTSEEA